MARALPLHAQPGQGHTHTLARDLDALFLCQIMDQRAHLNRKLRFQPGIVKLMDHDVTVPQYAAVMTSFEYLILCYFTSS